MRTLRHLGMVAAFSILPACNTPSKTKNISPPSEAAACEEVRRNVVAVLLAKHVYEERHPGTAYLSPDDVSRANQGRFLMDAIAQVQDEFDCIDTLRKGQ